MKKSVIIIGASSSIAQAIVEQLVDDLNTQIILVGRDLSMYTENFPTYDNVFQVLIADYEESLINLAVEEIEQKKLAPIRQIFICNGLLHNKKIQPEKKLEDFNPSSFTEIMKANTLTPILWIKALLPLITLQEDCKIVVFSARVGSISDNKLGGWFCYRSSKAALNMLLKNVAIEFARRAKLVKLISFHPGTTDTPLSAPFQKNVPEGKLFRADFVAKQLLNILDNTEIDGTLSFIDWQGETIGW